MVNPSPVDWLAVNALPFNDYDKSGDPVVDGTIKFIDGGPPEIDNIIKDMSSILTKNNQFSVSKEYDDPTLVMVN